MPMESCPKCNGVKIDGPVYVPKVQPRGAMQVSSGDGLQYRCRTCNYIWHKSCEDKENRIGKIQGLETG